MPLDVNNTFRRESNDPQKVLIYLLVKLFLCLTKHHAMKAYLVSGV
jgi:hypothetical protein